MKDRKIFDRLIAVLALLAAFIAAYFAYRTYVQDFQPQPDLTFYKIVGDTKTFDDFIEIDTNNVKQANGYIELDLPIRLGNNGESDANKIIIWLGPQSSDTFNLLINEQNSSWREAIKNQQKWYSTARDHLPPLSEVPVNSFKISIKEGTKEVKLFWTILASRMSPKNGTLIIKL